MGEWPVRTVGELVTLQRGIDLPSSRRKAGCVPIIGSFGITGYHNRAAARGPGVTVGRSGASIGALHYVDRDFWPLNTCLYVKDFHGNNPRFSYYLLRSLDLSQHNSGSAQPSLNRNYVHPLPVAFPQRKEQDAVADLLGALDDKIELNRRMNGTLEAMARAIFKDWFIDFGPTRAKMEGRPPYLAADLWSLFPDRLNDDDLPEGWEASTLAAVAALNPEAWSRGNAPREIEYVDLANTKWGVIESTQLLSWTAAPSRAQRVLRRGDTIVGTVRPGNGSYAFVGTNGLTGSTGFAVLRPIHSRFREFVYLSSTSAENIERLSHRADGAAYPAVRPDAVAETEVVVPGEDVMDGFSQVAAPLIERWEANKRECLTLAATRDLLLPKLMSGEIRLRDAEKAVEAAL